MRTAAELIGTLLHVGVSALLMFMSLLVAPPAVGLPIQVVVFGGLYVVARPLARTQPWVWLLLPVVAFGAWLVVITLGSELLGWTA